MSVVGMFAITYERSDYSYEARTTGPAPYTGVMMLAESKCGNGKGPSPNQRTNEVAFSQYLETQCSPALKRQFVPKSVRRGRKRMQNGIEYTALWHSLAHATLYPVEWATFGASPRE